MSAKSRYHTASLVDSVDHSRTTPGPHSVTNSRPPYDSIPLEDCFKTTPNTESKWKCERHWREYASPPQLTHGTGARARGPTGRSKIRSALVGAWSSTPKCPSHCGESTIEEVGECRGSFWSKWRKVPQRELRNRQVNKFRTPQCCHTL